MVYVAVGPEVLGKQPSGTFSFFFSIDLSNSKSKGATISVNYAKAMDEVTIIDVA